jgi:hypothetical protein
MGRPLNVTVSCDYTFGLSRYLHLFQLTTPKATETEIEPFGLMIYAISIVSPFRG